MGIQQYNNFNENQTIPASINQNNEETTTETEIFEGSGVEFFELEMDENNKLSNSTVLPELSDFNNNNNNTTLFDDFSLATSQATGVEGGVVVNQTEVLDFEEIQTTQGSFIIFDEDEKLDSNVTISDILPQTTINPKIILATELPNLEKINDDDDNSTP